MIKFTQKIVVSALVGFCLLGTGISSVSADSQGLHKKIMVDDAWARARGATAKIAGAFMTLSNMSGHDDRLVSASSDIAKRVEIHTTKMVEGVMKMTQLKEGIAIKAGEKIMMKPGGYHVMFLGLSAALPEGTTFPVTLSFEKAGDVDVTVSVKKAGAMGSMSHGKTKMKHD
ncbi:MAG: copper chaperone PCu(A)C [Sneathiella sp.]